MPEHDDLQMSNVLDMLLHSEPCGKVNENEMYVSPSTLPRGVNTGSLESRPPYI